MPATVAAPTGPQATHGSAQATRQTLLGTHWWTPGLLSIRVTRPPAFRFTPGHYARVGLPTLHGAPVVRPLSIASAPDDRHLEFFCTLVPGGEFSHGLASARVGDDVEIEKASFGFLTLDALAPGADLWLLATGTGLAPFVSMLRDGAAERSFARIVLVHSVRQAAELAYADELRQRAAAGVVRYLPVVTREPLAAGLRERIPALLASGRLMDAAGVALDASTSRVMVCGNPGMNRALRAWLGERGFHTTRRGVRGQMAFENYWQENRT